MSKLKKAKAGVISELADDLTDQMRAFALEYIIDFDGTRAAIAAGYSEKTATVMASKLLNHPRIKDAIQRATKSVLRQSVLTKERVLYEIACCAFRTSDDFLDEKTGRIKGDLRELSEPVKHAVDSIKQRVRRTTDDEGNVTEEIIETEIKLVSKEAALEMANKHLGLYAPEQHEHAVRFNWDDLYAKPVKPPNVLDIPVPGRFTVADTQHTKKQAKLTEQPEPLMDEGELVP